MQIQIHSLLPHFAYANATMDARVYSLGTESGPFLGKQTSITEGELSSAAFRGSYQPVEKLLNVSDATSKII
jgi:hypothetical protein